MTSDNDPEETGTTLLLKVLLRQRHLQVYSAFAREYIKAAAKLDRELMNTGPSKAQFYRWLSGELTKLPYSHHCRVLEAMFPDWGVAQLFQPYSGSISVVPRPGASAPAPPPTISTPSRQVDAGKVVSHELDLSGDWWCAWQTSKDDVPRVDVHMLTVHQQGERLQLEADRAPAEGSYSWRGELCIWDNEALMGWYRSTEGAVRSKGTMYLALHPHGEHAWGRWTGMSYDGVVVTGWGVIARNEELAHRVAHNLVDAGRP
ncbi:hypothetical protein [Actinophytocola oryzae]|uniref:Uncharacterized protein n=1 Tax=Actinophytocola oryzae TaxID=502181 RepID=A0A4R7VTB6_9PSEU|nr:hypothetical protein [Actinophytocola oryzae]TDV52457.1 hypothetical protein CLV71_105589 [Actinophytocola oryzae]